MKTILFQGDSITDAGRKYEDDTRLGYGYANMTNVVLETDYPGAYQVVNRGISGNRVIDLLARVKSDIINLKPDYMSILIGVNDVWHELNFQNGVDTERYERYYHLLIEQVKEALPDLKIMILEPFVLRGQETSKSEEYWRIFRSEVEQRAAAAKRVAEKHNLVFIPLMEIFDEADKTEKTGYWLADGVHPTDAGFELIKREWLKGFERLNGTA